MPYNGNIFEDYVFYFCLNGEIRVCCRNIYHFCVSKNNYSLSDNDDQYDFQDTDARALYWYHNERKWNEGIVTIVLFSTIN